MIPNNNNCSLTKSLLDSASLSAGLDDSSSLLALSQAFKTPVGTNPITAGLDHLSNLDPTLDQNISKSKQNPSPNSSSPGDNIFNDSLIFKQPSFLSNVPSPSLSNNSITSNTTAGSDPVTGSPLNNSLNLANLKPLTLAQSPSSSPTSTPIPNLIGKFGNFDGHHDVKLTVKDAHGVPVTFFLEGKGYGEVIGNSSFDEVILQGTNDQTQVKISTPGNQETAIKDIVVDGSLRNLTAGTTDLQGNLNVTGSLDELSLDNVTGPHTISIGAATNPDAAVSLQLHQVEDLSLLSAMPIDSLAATEWLNTDNSTETISAPVLNQLKILGNKKDGIAGDFDANLQLTGMPNQSEVLRHVKIAGQVAGTWQVTGNVGELSLGSTTTDWSINISGQLQQLQVDGNLSGTVAAKSFQRIKVGGNLINASLLAGANLGTDGRLGGTGTATDQFGPGKIEHLQVGGTVVSSVVGAGLDPVDGIFNNSNDTLLGGTNSAIRSINIGGNTSSDSLFAAGAFGKNIRINGATINPQTDSRFLTPNKPVITAALADDTGFGGTTNNDGVTSDPSIVGKVISNTPITDFRAGFDNTATANFKQILLDLNPDGSFTLNRAAIAQVYGGTLPDGPHTLHFQAADAQGDVSRPAFAVPFTLDTTAPPAPSGLNLLPTSDSGRSNSDYITKDTTPTITGNTEAGSVVQLFRTINCWVKQQVQQMVPGRLLLVP